MCSYLPQVADKHVPAVEDEGILSPEEPPAAQDIDTVDSNALEPAASDVTLTSEVVDERLPVEPRKAETEMHAKVEPVQGAVITTVDDENVAPADRDTSSAPRELPAVETANETRVYIDVTGGNFAAWKAREAKRPSSIKLHDHKTAKLAMTTAGPKPREEEPPENDVQQRQVGTAAAAVNLGQKNLETTSEEMPENAEDQVSAKADQYDDVQLETSSVGIECSADDDGTKMDGGAELTPIKLPCSDDDDDDGPDSPSVFSTCDEWLESPTCSAGKTRDQAQCLPPLSEQVSSSDSVAELAEPDDIDLLPYEARRRVAPALPVRQTLPATAYTAAYVNSTGTRSSANVCCAHCARADKPASYHRGLAQPSPTTTTKRRPHSAVSPSPGGRIPYEASAMQRSRFTRPSTAAGGASRASACPRPTAVSQSPASRRGTTPATPAMQPHEARAARSVNAKPTSGGWQKPRKPAWK